MFTTKKKKKKNFIKKIGINFNGQEPKKSALNLSFVLFSDLVIVMLGK